MSGIKSIQPVTQVMGNHETDKPDVKEKNSTGAQASADSFEKAGNTKSTFDLSVLSKLARGPLIEALANGHAYGVARPGGGMTTHRDLPDTGDRSGCSGGGGACGCSPLCR